MQNSFSEKNSGAKFFVKSTLLLKTILSLVLDVEEALQVGGTAVYRTISNVSEPVFSAM